MQTTKARKGSQNAKPQRLPPATFEGDVYFDDEKRANEYRDARNAAGFPSQVSRVLVKRDPDTGAAIFDYKVTGGDGMNRATARRARILDEGGAQLSLLIGKDAREALDTLVGLGEETKTQIIERLLVEAASTVPGKAKAKRKAKPAAKRVTTKAPAKRRAR